MSSEDQEKGPSEMTQALRPKKPGQDIPGVGGSKCKGPEVGAHVKGLAGRPALPGPQHGG